MRLCTLAVALLAALAAGCDRSSEPKASTTPPTTASAGASRGAVETAPKGDSVPLPPSSKAGATSAGAKPDPGDANDHSSPQHDAKQKKSGD